MKKKFLFSFANWWAVITCAVIGLAAVEFIVADLIVYKFDLCSLFPACTSERSTAPFESAGVQFVGGMILMAGLGIYFAAAMFYWDMSTQAAFGNLKQSKRKLFLCAVVPPMPLSVMCFILASPGYFSLILLFASSPLISLLSFQIHWRVLLWLKQKMLGADPNGELVCQN